MYFIQGEFDELNISAKQYFDQLIAPEKEFITIKNSGHVVRGDQPEEFNKILFDKVLPETYK